MKGKISIDKLRKVAEISIEAEPEQIPIEGNASAWGEPEDSEYAAEIRAQLEVGNEWAWCSVKVTARLDGWEGVDYLGGCSYKDAEDFKQPGGYYDDMVTAALNDLARNIEAAAYPKPDPVAVQLVKRLGGFPLNV